jgi:hypothetical protein
MSGLLRNNFGYAPRSRGPLRADKIAQRSSANAESLARNDYLEEIEVVNYTLPEEGSILFNVGGEVDGIGGEVGARAGVKTDGSKLEVPYPVVIGGGAAGTNAVLTINGSKAASIPSVTTGQRTAMSPVTGSIVYDSTLGRLFVYDGSSWVSDEIESIGDTGFSGSTRSSVGYLANGEVVFDDNFTNTTSLSSNESIRAPSIRIGGRLYDTEKVSLVQFNFNQAAIETDPTDFSILTCRNGNFLVGGGSDGLFSIVGDSIRINKNGVYRVHVYAHIIQINHGNEDHDFPPRLALVLNYNDETKTFGREYFRVDFDKDPSRSFVSTFSYTDIVIVDQDLTGGRFFDVGLQVSTVSPGTVSYNTSQDRISQMSIEILN